MKDSFLPCFVCDKTLQNVFEESTCQPYEGTVFYTEGHYGSTFWDSFDGEELVVLICDSCLRKGSARLGQKKAYIPVFCEGFLVGREFADRPLIAYCGSPDDTRVNVEVEELGVLPDIEWAKDIDQIKKYLSRKQE